ncbi:MAG: hypothetical protein KF872_05020 [Chitinophagales bacterium]|nr:hypothetical protein [Chitinophagales bacterium]
MSNQIRVTILWLVLVVCMMLHFDYHVSEIFYGIDVKRSDANGTVPNTIVVIRTLFHFLPLLYVAVLLWLESKLARLLNVVLSGLYLLSHTFHLVGEVQKFNNPSQIVLLSVTLVLASLLVLASYKWLKEINS